MVLPVPTADGLDNALLKLLKPYANLICGILIYELKRERRQAFWPATFPVVQVEHVPALWPEKFGHPLHEPQLSASAGFAFMLNAKSSSCLILFSFDFLLAVLFGLAVFKYFLCCCCGKRRQQQQQHEEEEEEEKQAEALLWLQFYSQKFGCCCLLSCCFCWGCCCCCCCYSVYLSICCECVRVSVCSTCVCVCGRLSGYQRWHKSFIYQPQLVPLRAGVWAAPCLMNTHKVANEATSRKSGKGSAHTRTHTYLHTYACIHGWHIWIYTYICI